METCKNLIEAEKAIQRKHMELARREYEDYLQRLAESTPSEGSDGKPLVKTRTIGMRVATGFGPVELKVKNGLCRSSGRYETPMRLRFFGGRRGCVSPAFEMRIAATAMETGSFEKASKLCREWGCPVSDDKVMDVVRDIAGRCEEGKLPRLCEEAAGSEDTLVIMMDGWFARHRGAGWGKRNPRAAERVEWREMKSATIFKLAHAAETSGGRRVLVTKHAVCMPAGTDPVDFGRKVEFEARRMGMMQAKFVYIVMDGGTYLWNIFEDRFATIAEGTLDYYHATEHLGALAAALFPDDEPARKAWLSERCRKLKRYGGKTLLDILKAHEGDGCWDAKAVQRETEYFMKHKDHMDYLRQRRLGRPIGSGAVESLCSQLQNRFKRCGQFWSAVGLESFLKAYIWYVNGELHHCCAQAAVPA
ncbi:MAG: hypothetical protein ACOX5G_13455 [Kiritimatiellia bacterium]|jgi:hypothetical protein